MVGLDPFAQAIGRTRESARPEGAFVEFLDGEKIGRRLRAEDEGKVRHSRCPLTEHRRRPPKAGPRHRARGPGSLAIPRPAGRADYQVADRG